MQKPVSTSLQLPSLGQLLLGVSGLVLNFGLAIVLLMAGGIMLIRNRSAGIEMVNIFSAMWQSGLVALLSIPSILYAGYRLFGKPKIETGNSNRRPFAYVLACLAMLNVPLLILAGNFVTGKSQWVWVLLPPIQILVVAIPLWWLYELGRRHLYAGSDQRRWGLLNFSLLITPLIIILVEVLIFGGVMVVLAGWLAFRPDLVRMLQLFSQRLAITGVDQQSIGLLLRPFLNQPLLLWGILAFFSGLIPLVEEFLKPMAIWLLMPKDLSPSEGFVLGLIGGSGFALIESLGTLAQAGEADWSIMVIGRIGTGLLHMTTTGLMGWGLASGWTGGNYFRLGAIYLVSVLMHGIWNAFAILFGFKLILPAALFDDGSLILRFVQISPLMLPWLGFVLLLILTGSNRILSRGAEK